MKVLVIAGPTGVGKTALAVEIAKKLNGEIISGDSVQVYKYLDIGSAKVTDKEMDGVKHHLIDYLEPDENYSVARFQKEVRQKITEITSLGKLPIICGGTGLYIKAALTKYEFEHNKRDLDYLTKFDETSNEDLHEILSKIDPTSANAFHKNNRRRILRAIEYFEVNGEMISSKKDSNESLYDSFIIGLRLDRQLLYDRINIRVDSMLESGLLDEVRSLTKYKESINAIGYNEMFNYLDGLSTFDDAVELMKQNSRRYAKRQFTWFSNQMETNWIDVENCTLEELSVKALNTLEKNKFI